MPTLFTPGIRRTFLPALARRANLLQRFKTAGASSSAAPPPVPPVPPLKSGRGKPFLRRDPTVDRREGRNWEILVEVLNSLFLQGFIYEVSKGVWALSPAGDTGLNGIFTGKFFDSITFVNGFVEDIGFDAIQAADLPLVPGTIAGDYTNPSLHVDQYGRITSIVSANPSLTIGEPVVGGTGFAVLYVDGSGKLADSGSFVFDPTTNSFVAGAFYAFHPAGTIDYFHATAGFTSFSRINKNGYFMTHVTSAPADAELINSEVAWWLDDTAGIPVVNFRGKDAAGTPFTATVGAGAGTVTSVSVVTANGFAGTVANPTTTPAITLTTSITGLLKGDGTAIAAAVAAAPAKLLGSALGGAGSPYSELNIGTGLSMSNGTLNATVTPGGGSVVAGGPDPITSIYPYFTPTGIDDEFDS